MAVLQLGKLGDMILTTPLFAALKQQYPGSELTVIAARESMMIARFHPLVDQVIDSPRGFRQLPTLAARVRSEHFDLYIDIKDHRSTTSRLVAEVVHARERVLDRANMARRAGSIELPPPLEPGHYVDKALAPLRALAPEEKFRRRPGIGIPQEAYRAVDDQIDPGEYGLVAVNISAGHPSRYWQPARWEYLIDQLSQRYSVAVLSTPADRALADEICTMRRRARPIRTENILEAAAVVERARAVISPDTSIIHLASALQRPTVGLYPESRENIRTFAPLSEPHRIITPPPGGEIADIGADEVLEAAGEVVGDFRF